MRWPLGALPPRWATIAVPALIALVIGIAVTLASSPASLTGRHTYVATAGAEPSPSPADASPSPSVTSPGLLGSGARLVLTASAVLIGSTPSLAMASVDQGEKWTTVRPPDNGSGIAVDAANVRHAITGGSTVRVSNDGGASWKPTRTHPPGTGPYQPLEISPFDGQVWFLIHQQRLVRTRDASLSWRELTSLPPLAAPVLVPGQLAGQFFLATGNRVFELTDNGQQIQELPVLPPGLTVADLVAAGSNPVSLLARGGTDSAFLLKGKTWSAAGGGLHGPVAVGANGLLLVGDGSARLGSAGSVAYSTDAGTTWTQATGLPADQSVEAIAGQPNSTTFFAYCYGGDLYTSNDGGHSWSLLTRSLRSP